MTVFWVIASCSFVEVYRRVRGACCPHRPEEELSTSETLVNFYQPTRRNNQADRHLHTRRSENLKSHFAWRYQEPIANAHWNNDVINCLSELSQNDSFSNTGNA
jgi:hypothetical protein